MYDAQHDDGCRLIEVDDSIAAKDEFAQLSTFELRNNPSEPGSEPKMLG